MLETLSYKRVKARKEHTCDFCGKTIVKGEKYDYSKHAHNGAVYGWHACDRCKKYAAEAYENNKNTMDYGLTAEMFENFMYRHYRPIAKEWWQ